MTNEIDLASLLDDTFKMANQIHDDEYGAVFETFRCIGDTCTKCYVRVLRHDIDVEKVKEMKTKLNDDDYLNFEVCTSRVIVTDTDGFTRIAEHMTSNGTLTCMSEFESCGIVYRVNEILLRNETEGISIYHISPFTLFVKPIEGVTHADRKSTHKLKVAEPYLSIIAETHEEVRLKDPYVVKELLVTKKRAMAWSLGMLMYHLSFGATFDGLQRQIGALSYEYSRIMFEMLHDDADLRMELSMSHRKLQALKDCDNLILYQSVSVEHLILIKGIYNGEIRYGIRHGFGNYESIREYGLSSEVSKYTGIYCLDKMHVKGEITFRNSDVYSGQISWDQPKGNGIYTKASGTVMKGEWDGTSLVPDSIADIRDPDPTDGWHYKGPVVKNQPSGEGRMVYQDGYVYVGHFEKGMKSGKGVLSDKDEGIVIYKYEGEWLDNLKHGQGEEFKAGEFKYEGHYNLGHFDGDGRLEHIKDQYKYEGEFRSGKPHGFGQMYWEDGTVYRGQLKAGQRDGYGTCEYPDGTSYDGQWARDKKNGEGTFITEEGWPVTKLFIDDEPVS